MDEKRSGSTAPVEPDPVDQWLREALEPPAGVAARLAATALARKQARQGAPSTAVWRVAAALLFGLGLAGVALCLLPRPPQRAETGAPPTAATADYLITNASGSLDLVRLRGRNTEAASPLVPAEGPGCTTLLTNQGDVIAVFDPCAQPRVRITGGT